MLLTVLSAVRPASGGGSGFLPREALLETMLHELTHMVRRCSFPNATALVLDACLLL